MKNLRPTRLYDVAILGNGLPGLVAGALLAQRGQRVLHLPHEPLDRYESGGFRLPVLPDLLPDPKRVPAMKEVLDELHLFPQFYRDLEPLPLQILLPEARLDLAEEGELERAFGERQGAAIAAGLARLAARSEETAAAARGPWLPRGLGERIRAWRHRRSHRELLAAPLRLDEAGPLAPILHALHRVSGAGAESAFAFARATAPLLPGIFRHPAGLRTLLSGHVAAHRGDRLEDVRAESIVLEGGRFAGLQIGGELWRARTLLAALPAARLTSLLPEGRRAARLAARLGAASSGRPLFVRSLILDPRGVPEPLGPLAVAAGFGDARAVIDQRADGERRILTVVSEEGGPALEALLEEVLPFHRRHLVHEATPEEEPKGLLSLQDPATPIPGLLLAGPDLLASMGVEGAFLAGRALAGRVLATTARGKTG